MPELTQLYSFTGLKVVENNTQTEQETNESNENFDRQSQKENTIYKSINTRNKIKTEKERKNRKLIEKILPQEPKEKSEHRESSRLRNQPRKNCKTFIPQSKILKKVEFPK